MGSWQVDTRGRDDAGVGEPARPGASPAPGLVAGLSRRKQFVAFVVGVALFVGGALTLTRNHQRTASRPLDGIPARDGGVPGTNAGKATKPVGPAVGASIGAYVDKRRATLRKLAAAKPGEVSWAVVSFDSYREPDAVASFVSGRPLTVAAFQQRVPAGSFAPEMVDIGKRKLGDVLDARAGDALAAVLERERSELERILPTVGDAAYREVYEADVRRLGEAIRLLETRPATVFALVVRAPNDALAKLAKVPGVRLVDVAEDPATTPGPHGFHGLLPDDLKIVTAGAPGP